MNHSFFHFTRRLAATLLVALLVPLGAWAQQYDFTATVDGNTLYFKITDATNHYVSVVSPSNSSWGSFTKPTGTVNLPATVTNESTAYTLTAIGNYAFSQCAGVTGVTIPSTVKTIGNNAFRYAGLTSLNVDVETIGNTAFANNSSLTTLTIGPNVKSIDYYAFQYCTSLERVTFNATECTTTSSVRSNGIFPQCTHAATLTIGSGVTSLPEYLFYNFTGLKEVADWGGVTTIGTRTFYGTGLTSLTIPNQVTSMGQYAFAWSKSLEHVTFGSGLAAVPQYAFSHCEALTGIAFNAATTAVGNYAFEYCSALNGGSSDISWGGVETIGNYAFGYCSGMTVLSLPGTVKTIGESAFYHTDIATLEVDIENIGSNAFAYNSSLTALTIGPNVKSIAAHAFQYCTALASVTFNATECTTASNVPSNPIFGGCTHEATLTIGSGVTSLPNYLFASFTGLKEVTIPAHVASLGSGVFSYCNLDRLVIADSETPLKYNGLYSPFGGSANWNSDHYDYTNGKITSAYIGRQLNNTYSTANPEYMKFANYIEELELGANVTDITQQFYATGGLKKITVRHTTPIAIADDAFSNMADSYHRGGDQYGTATLWVPERTKSKYLAATGWKEFTNDRIKSERYHIDLIANEGGTLASGETYQASNTTVDMPVAPGAGASFTLAADENHDITSLQKDGVAADIVVTASKTLPSSVVAVSAGTYELSGIDIDHTLTATFTHKPSFNVTATVSAGNGTVQVDDAEASSTTSAKSIVRDHNTTVTVACAKNYEVKTFTVDGVDKKADLIAANYTLPVNDVQADVAISVEFQKIMLDVAMTAGTGGTLKVTIKGVDDDNIKVKEGTMTMFIHRGASVTFTAARNDFSDGYYDFQSLKLGDDVVVDSETEGASLAGGSYTIADLQDDVTFTAAFVEQPTNYIFVDIGQGTTYESYMANQSKSLSSDEYKWATEEHGSVTLSNGRVIRDVIQEWDDADWDLSVIPTVHRDETITMTITPDEGYGLTAVAHTKEYEPEGIIDKTDITSAVEGNVLTLTPAMHAPEKEYSAFFANMITPIFEKLHFTVTKNTPENGSVALSSDDVEWGTDLAVTMTPDEGYEVASVLVNGVDMTDDVVDVVLTLTDVRENKDVVVTFRDITYTTEFITLAHSQQTFSCPQALDFTDVSGLTAYIASGYDDGTVTLTRVEKVPAGTGLLIVGTEGQTYKIPYADVKGVYSNFLKPVLTAQTIAATTDEYTNYLYDEADGVKGFYQLEGDGELSARKAYLQLPTSAVTDVKVLTLSFDDHTTGVSSTDGSRPTHPADAVYDLNGRKAADEYRPAHLPRGIYIVNGQKVAHRK